MVTGADSSPEVAWARSDTSASRASSRRKYRCDRNAISDRRSPVWYRRRARLPGARAPGRVPAPAPARPVRAGSGHRVLASRATPRTLASSRSSSMTHALSFRPNDSGNPSASCGSCGSSLASGARRHRRRPARPDPTAAAARLARTPRGVLDPPAAAGRWAAHRERSHRAPAPVWSRGRQVRHRHRAAGWLAGPVAWYRRSHPW